MINFNYIDGDFYFVSQVPVQQSPVWFPPKPYWNEFPPLPVTHLSKMNLFSI